MTIKFGPPDHDSVYAAKIFHKFEDDTNYSTTSSTLNEAYSFTTESLPSGVYKVNAYIHNRGVGYDERTKLELRIDGTAEPIYWHEATTPNTSTSTNDRSIVHLIAFPDFENAGTHTLDIYCGHNGSGSVLLDRCLITIERKS